MYDGKGDGLFQKFDTFCKTVIRYKAYKITRDKKRWKQKNQMYSYIGDDNLQQIAVEDIYSFLLLEIDLGDISIGIKDEHLYLSLLKLPENRLRIIMLSFFHGFSDGQISKIMKIPKSTVQYNRDKAIKQLRIYMKG